jgi:hypothetical protein
VAGTVTDNGTVTLVTWATDRGASGVAIGTNNWSITQLPLSVGLNTITITAQDAAGNVGSPIDRSQIHARGGGHHDCGHRCSRLQR